MEKWTIFYIVSMLIFLSLRAEKKRKTGGKAKSFKQFVVFGCRSLSVEIDRNTIVVPYEERVTN